MQESKSRRHCIEMREESPRATMKSSCSFAAAGFFAAGSVLMLLNAGKELLAADSTVLRPHPLDLPQAFHGIRKLTADHFQRYVRCYGIRGHAGFPRFFRADPAKLIKERQKLCFLHSSNVFTLRRSMPASERIFRRTERTAFQFSARYCRKRSFSIISAKMIYS